MTPDEVIEHKHALSGMAELLFSYFHSLMIEGFTAEQSIRLVIGYQAALIRSSVNSDGDSA